MFITVPVVVAILGVWGGGNINEAYKHNHPNKDAIPCVNFSDDPAYFQLEEGDNCEGRNTSSCATQKTM